MASNTENITFDDRTIHHEEKEPVEPSPLIYNAVAAQILAPKVTHESDEEISNSHDPTSPLNWSYRRKMCIVILVSAMTTVE